MIADVRLKVEQRVRAFMERLVAAMQADHAEMNLIRAAQDDYATAEALSAKYRSKFVREFGGCEITFTPNNVYIRLPNGYPQHGVPIRKQLHPLLTQCIYAKGLTLKPF